MSKFQHHYLVRSVWPSALLVTQKRHLIGYWHYPESPPSTNYIAFALMEEGSRALTCVLCVLNGRPLRYCIAKSRLWRTGRLEWHQTANEWTTMIKWCIKMLNVKQFNYMKCSHTYSKPKRWCTMPHYRNSCKRNEKNYFKWKWFQLKMF